MLATGMASGLSTPELDQVSDISLSDEEDELEWTMSPISRKQLEGHSRVWLTVPRAPKGTERQHNLHIDRELEIGPPTPAGRTAKKLQDALSKSKGQVSLTVKASDLEKFGSNLAALKRCDLSRKDNTPCGKGVAAATALRQDVRLLCATLGTPFYSPDLRRRGGTLGTPFSSPDLRKDGLRRTNSFSSLDDWQSTRASTKEFSVAAWSSDSRPPSRAGSRSDTSSSKQREVRPFSRGHGSLPRLQKASSTTRLQSF
eukprot:TRINITY_DN42961_c0_g1_i1.p1 TRINITY_DN42961_c0_g1~~TRINITY_DN42961_c0_g1_i1.p1  ORF type:complete len:257 (+),score=52.80 TRINITY_DN42961_c0_g1_i1:110-880(+)